MRSVLCGSMRQRFLAFLRLIWGASWKKGHFEHSVSIFDSLKLCFLGRWTDSTIGLLPADIFGWNIRILQIRDIYRSKNVVFISGHLWMNNQFDELTTYVLFTFVWAFEEMFLLFISCWTCVSAVYLGQVSFDNKEIACINLDSVSHRILNLLQRDCQLSYIKVVA